MAEKDIKQEKWDAQIRLLNEKVEELKAKAGQVREEARIEYLKGLEALKSKQTDLEKKIQELKNEGENASADLRSGIESAIVDLRRAVDTAVSRFKK